MSSYVQKLMAEVKSKNAAEQEFHEAVKNVAESLDPVLERYPQYRQAMVLERIVEPERTITFRISWVDDAGRTHVNRGYRVQMNGAIGPYKGGLRFHPSVNLGILKGLALEQIFKNSLTTLPMGAGYGGADFDPKGKSDREVMRFCQSYMNELFRYIGPNTDIPDGDIGVGGREIGYLFGQYRKLANEFAGVLTGKGLNWSGSLMRSEATGYGVVYFATEMLAARGETLNGKTCLVSGSGKVAQSAIEKLIELGATVVTFSDSSGCVYDPNGMDHDKLEWLKGLKNLRRGHIREFAEKYPSAEYISAEFGGLDENPLWARKADCAFPCATQHEINRTDAENLLRNGVMLVCEGANMPLTPDAMKLLTDRRILYAPGKAANAGGVAVSGLEMAQNSMRYAWTREEVDSRLKIIMKGIHKACLDAAAEFGTPGNVANGANIAGFMKVAGAMMDQGVI
ncbi:MAG: NADP-specific glutamate dehydrogenase [Chitinivibrionia bacterium]|nr:NADP-specific glutamate dehydrogenase [Chitinivibrionia bacterium]